MKFTDEQMERMSKLACERLKEEFSGHDGPLTKAEKERLETSCSSAWRPS